MKNLIEPYNLAAWQRVQDWQGIWIWRIRTEDVLLAFAAWGMKAQLEASQKAWDRFHRIDPAVPGSGKTAYFPVHPRK